MTVSSSGGTRVHPSTSSWSQHQARLPWSRTAPMARTHRCQATGPPPLMRWRSLRVIQAFHALPGGHIQRNSRPISRSEARSMPSMGDTVDMRDAHAYMGRPAAVALRFLSRTASTCVTLNPLTACEWRAAQRKRIRRHAPKTGHVLECVKVHAHRVVGVVLNGRRGGRGRHRV